MTALPRGTVTFLFTDIESSTRLLRQLADRYGEVLTQHHAILREACATHDGWEIDNQGDAFFFGFPRARDAVAAAVEVQRTLGAREWPDGVDVRVRIGIHTGEPVLAADRYVGLDVVRASRICGVAVGAQILVSRVTRDLVVDALPADVTLRDVGERPLKDFEQHERLFEVRTEPVASLRPAEREPRRDELAVSLLGPLVVTRSGHRLDLGPPQQRALLALLALRGGALVTSDRIVDALWPADPPASAHKIVQTYVSRLRKLLGEDAIERLGSGYLLRVTADSVDVARFEGLAAAGRLAEALTLWRGPALGDVAHVGGLRAEAERLEELRLRTLEERLDADLDAGLHHEVVPELRTLVGSQPMRERLRQLLMLALYRSGRQAEALEVYAESRRLLVEEFGLEPSERLRELQAAILRRDADLLAPSQTGAPATTAPSVLVWRAWDASLQAAVGFAEALACEREVIVADVLSAGGDLPAAASALEELRRSLEQRGVTTRVVAFTSTKPGSDAARLAADQDAALAVVPCPPSLVSHGVVPRSLVEAFAEAVCDVAVVTDRGLGHGGPVVVPFGAAEHDWTALELGAWAALSLDRKLHVLGSAATVGARDASRTLATASLLLQRHVGVSAQPVLAEPGERGMLNAVADAALVVAGIPDGWRSEGFGATRLALLRQAAPAVVLVRRGERPGGLAPRRAVTRFSWSRGR